MLSRTRLAAALALSFGLAACATAPVGPRVAVMPAPGKPMDLFMAEDRDCRDWADRSVNPQRAERANNDAVGTAVAGALIGAAAGALIDGHRGAGTGASLGLLMGTASGAENSAASSRQMQRQYDIAYQQCMYSKGNQIPGYAARPAPPPPPPGYRIPSN